MLRFLILWGQSHGVLFVKGGDGTMERNKGVVMKMAIIFMGVLLLSLMGFIGIPKNIKKTKIIILKSLKDVKKKILNCSKYLKMSGATKERFGSLQLSPVNNNVLPCIVIEAL